MVITATDGDGNLYYWWGPPDGSNWHRELLVSAAELGEQGFQNPPNAAIAWTGTSVVITAPDWEGNLYYWWQQAGSGTWHRETVAASGGSAGVFYENPAIAWTGTSVVITAPDSDGNLHYWWQAGRQRHLAPGTGSHGTSGRHSSPAVPGHRLDGYVCGHHRHRQRRQHILLVAAGRQRRLAPGTRIPGTIFGAETAPLPQNSAVAWTGTSVVVAATDGSGSLYYWWQQAGSGDWHQELVGKADVNP